MSQVEYTVRTERRLLEQRFVEIVALDHRWAQDRLARPPRDSKHECVLVAVAVVLGHELHRPGLHLLGVGRSHLLRHLKAV
ncbi:MAG: hypothetical protein IH827_00065 [Myxococcales bacterium]|nr:hypothetical protein [Myxococcales bacterium]